MIVYRPGVKVGVTFHVKLPLFGTFAIWSNYVSVEIHMI